MCYKKQKKTQRDLNCYSEKKTKTDYNFKICLKFWMLLSWNEFALYVKELASGCIRTLETPES